jgi:hypothetical protein
MGWEKLESDDAIQLGVLGFVDDPHTPFTKLLQNLVV